jgi:hypothetical protein
MSCDRLSAASAGLAFELLLRLAQIRILTTTREHSSALVGSWRVPGVSLRQGQRNID